MTDQPSRGQLARKVATVAAVVLAGFLSFWSALGITDGVVLAIVLGAAVARSILRNDPLPCLSRRRWSR
jgi:hypothetical protein